MSASSDALSSRMPPDDKKELFHTSRNPTGKETIALLHAFFCSHLEFELVAPHLSAYHLLLIDLPCHSGSRASSTAPWTIRESATRVADVIRAHARDGRAHVVRVSAGGFVGMQLARQNPELVLSVFASGCTPFQGYQRWFATHPRALYPVVSMQGSWLPEPVYRFATARMGMLPHEELRKETRVNMSYELMKDGYADMANFTLEEDVLGLARVGVRTLVLAGTIVDDVKSAGVMGRLLRENGSCESIAVSVRGAQHL
ncbi:alpha/beta-hydrolase [Xylariaceae sp. FL1019]|nr:alpha/beta-hydrolase [Xylariaceae sp. FL1019]